MAKRMRGIGSRTIDVRRLAEAVKSSGIDTRYWSSHGTVGTTGDDGTFNPNDDLAVHIAADSVWADVLLEPLGQPVTCRVALGVGGKEAVIQAPIHPGDEVLVVIPGGDFTNPPTIVAILNNLGDKIPISSSDSKPIFKNDRLLILAKSVPVEVRSESDDVILNRGTRGVARIDDTTQLTLSPTDVQTLASALLATGAFVGTGSGPFPGTQTTFTDGKITSSSGTVKAGD